MDEIYPNTNIILKIRSYSLGLDLLQTATESWDEALPLIQGSNIPLINLTDLTQKTIKAMGGLRELGMTENITATRAQYVKIYNDLLEVKKRNLLCGK